MEKKNFSKKLRLNKETISSLTAPEMNIIAGGYTPPSMRETCNCGSLTPPTRSTCQSNCGCTLGCTLDANCTTYGSRC